MSSGPLEGISVVEVGNFMAAPFCAMQLADLGADVVKVENRDGGDLTRLRIHLSPQTKALLTVLGSLPASDRQKSRPGMDSANVQ